MWRTSWSTDLTDHADSNPRCWCKCGFVSPVMLVTQNPYPQTPLPGTWQYSSRTGHFSYTLVAKDFFRNEVLRLIGISCIKLAAQQTIKVANLISLYYAQFILLVYTMQTCSPPAPQGGSFTMNHHGIGHTVPIIYIFKSKLMSTSKV